MNTVSQIEQQLNIYDFYPYDAFMWTTGKAVYEFPFIQKVNDKDFVVHIQRHYALNPFQLAEKASWKFDNLHDAYNKWNDLKESLAEE